MKFSLVAFLAAVGVTSAKKVINKRALLRNAVPVDKNGNRRLDQDEFEITGQYSIQFNHCLSLKISSDDYEDYLFDNNVVGYTKEGKVVAQTSFVLFNICYTQNCYYEDDSNLYMVDLPTYMGAIVEGAQEKEENFCEACEESYETCYPEEEEEEEEQEEEEDQEEDEEQEEEEEDEGDDEGEEDDEERRRRRRLEDNGIVYYENQGYIVVDCDTCEAKGCFEEEQEQYDENNANYQITDEVIDEWIQDMLECVDTEVVGPTGEDNLYAGFMCNSEGSGVEPAIFLENGCSVYTSMYSYGNLVSGTNNYKIMYKAADHVTTGFLEEQDCEDIQYLSIEGAEEMAYEAQQQAYENAQNGDNEDEEEWEAPEAAEVCRNLMDDAVDLDTCGGYEEDYNEEDEDVYDEEDEDYSWYTYLVAADAADDAQGTCVVVAALEGEYSMAHTYTEKDGEGGGSGHVYDYKSSGAFGGEGLNAGKIFGIIIAVIVVIVAAVLIMQSMGGKKDAKKVPLVNNKSGAMA